MAIIIGVRFREVGRVYYFDPGPNQVKKGERVIVETARGIECGECVQENTDVPEEQIKRPLKTMIRKATEADLAVVEGKAAKEAEAFKICEEKILRHGLDMKLVSVEYTFDGGKIIFHFTADQRVDFRALVRDLAGVFRTRIELRQIGVRDEAKLLGGLGVCGRPFCCSLFMGDFHPVSIKMAKEQGLSLNPTKISGTCGRLMCCLKYEEAAYEDALKTLPKIGSAVDTPEGRGVVTEVNAVSQAIKVRLDRRPEAAPMTFQYDTEKGVQRRAPTMRGLDPLEPMIREKLPADFSAPKSEQDEKPRHEPRQRHKSRNQSQRPQKQGQPQQKQERPPQKNKPAQQQQKPAAAAKPAPQHAPSNEIRRANAPKPAPQQDGEKLGGNSYRRQPWQKRREQKNDQKKDQNPKN